MHHGQCAGGRLFVSAALLVAGLSLAGATPVTAQERPDTVAADTLEESLARELERLLGDTAAQPAVDARATAAASQGLNPAISAIGELIVDASRDVEEPRFEVREIELALQAAVDPYLRADFFLGVHGDAIEIEEAYLTALALPAALQLRLGRFLLPFGKVNLTHRPELRTIDYPLAIRELFGEEGFAATGAMVSRVFAPLGFYQELQLVVSAPPGEEHGHGEEEGEEEAEPLFTAEPELRDELAGLVHLRNYWDLSAATNIELGFSAAAGPVRHLEEVACGSACADPDSLVFAEVFERSSHFGADLTIRWRPAREGLYRSFVWNTEAVAARAEARTRWAGFTQAQWQLTRRWYIGARGDAVEVEHEDEPVEWLYAGSGYLTFFPSEFSRFKLGVERTFGPAAEQGSDWTARLQTTFALGPHRPHAF